GDGRGAPQRAGQFDLAASVRFEDVEPGRAARRDISEGILVGSKTDAGDPRIWRRHPLGENDGARIDFPETTGRLPIPDRHNTAACAQGDESPGAIEGDGADLVFGVITRAQASHFATGTHLPDARRAIAAGGDD